MSETIGGAGAGGAGGAVEARGSSARAGLRDVEPLHLITAADLPLMTAANQLFCSALGALASPDGFVLCVTELLEKYGPVPLISLDDLPPDALCASVGAVGGLPSLRELPPCGDEFELVVRTLEGRLGRSLDALVSLNAVGPNALAPIAAAAVLGLPLVDCDGMGRVFPLIHQTSYALAGLPLLPLAAVSQTGDVVVLETPGSARADLLLRGIVHASGGLMLCSMYPAAGERLRRSAIRGSTSRLMRVGRALTTVRGYEPLLAELARTVRARVIGSGRITELGNDTRSVATREYLTVPTSIVISQYTETGRILRLEGQNELLLAMVDGAVVAAVPDLLCLFDRRELRVVGLEDLDIGDHVDVLVVPADPVWHSPAGLELVGPRAFGFPIRHPREEGR